MQFCKTFDSKYAFGAFSHFLSKNNEVQHFFNENSHNIFVELFTPLIEMQKVNTNEVHIVHAKCKIISSFYGSLASFNILPHVCLCGNI